MKYTIRLAVTLFFMSTLFSTCSHNVHFSTPDQIFDDIDGTTNHANDPDSNL